MIEIIKNLREQYIQRKLKSMRDKGLFKEDSAVPIKQKEETVSVDEDGYVFIHAEDQQTSSEENQIDDFE